DLTTCRRAHCQRRRSHAEKSKLYHAIGGGSWAARNVRLEGVHRCRRADRVWAALPRPLSSCRHLRRQNSSRRQSLPSSGRATDEIRADPQPQGRKGNRAPGADDIDGSRRRGDRMMKRREFITFLGGAAAWPLAAGAQKRLPVIGFLNGASPGPYARFLLGFHQGLKETGYTAGENVAVEYRWAENRYDRLPALAADLVDRHVTVIAAAGSTPAALAPKAAQTTIPIVFLVGGDPVAVGLVPSLARPGGNLTGVTNLTAEVGPKRLEMLHAVVPTATIALLVNPKSPELSEPQSQELQVAARKLGLQLHVLNASTEPEIDTAFATLVQLRAGGLVIGADALFSSRVEQLAALALRHRIPAIYQFPEFTAAGGLMSYGNNLSDMLRLSGLYTGRILKGEKPADLPVQQATKVELIINLKTAKALGLTMPTALLVRADEVIE